MMIELLSTPPCALGFRFPSQKQELKYFPFFFFFKYYRTIKWGNFLVLPYFSYAEKLEFQVTESKGTLLTGLIKISWQYWQNFSTNPLHQSCLACLLSRQVQAPTLTSRIRCSGNGAWEYDSNAL